MCLLREMKLVLDFETIITYCLSCSTLLMTAGIVANSTRIMYAIPVITGEL